MAQVNNDLRPEWYEIARQLEAHGAMPGQTADYIGFHSDLARAYGPVREALCNTRALEGLEGKTSLTEGDIPLESQLLLNLQAAIKAALAANHSQSETLKPVFEAGEKDPEMLRLLVRNAVFHWDGPELKALARGLGVPYVALLLYGRMLAAPFMIEAARVLDPTPVPEDQPHRTCPTCGSAPGLAFLSGKAEGKRYLVCSICETTWTFPRLQCPFCGTRDQSQLGTLAPEGQDSRWIETCDSCHRYIKTIDGRKLSAPIIPFVEDAATLSLDIIAEVKGFVRRLY